MSGKTCRASLSFTQYFLSNKSFLLPRTNICRLGSQIDVSELLWSSTPEYIPDSQALPSSYLCFLASWSYQVLVMPGLGSPESVPITVSMLQNQDVPMKHESGKISDWLWRLPLILKLNEVLKKYTNKYAGVFVFKYMSWMLIGSWFQELSLGIAFPGLQVVPGAAAEWLEGRARTTHPHHSGKRKEYWEWPIVMSRRNEDGLRHRASLREGLTRQGVWLPSLAESGTTPVVHLHVNQRHPL